jgi:hypothetical protein
MPQRAMRPAGRSSTARGSSATSAMP